MSEVDASCSKSRHSAKASREHSRHRDDAKAKDKKEKRRKSRSSNSGRNEVKSLEDATPVQVTDFPVKFDPEEPGPSHGNACPIELHEFHFIFDIYQCNRFIGNRAVLQNSLENDFNYLLIIVNFNYSNSLDRLINSI